MANLLTPVQCARAELLSRSHSTYAVSAITGISRNSLWHLKRRGWRALPSQKPIRPRPSDFAIQARHMTNLELCRLYRASTRAITRWRRELAQ